jgi:quinol monooxygenase YgiN
MASEKLRIIARLESKPEKVAELREVLLGLLAPTREEAGCIRYEMLENQADPTEFTFTEEWTDAAALAAHFESDHIRNALARFPDLLAKELDLRRYSLVG